MKKKIINILKQSNTLPFMFVGSGLSRRYLDLENWEGLLRKFASLASEQEFSYELFLQQADILGNKEGQLPKVAEIIEHEFNKKWFKDDRFAANREMHKENIAKHISPFKLEIADYTRIKSQHTNEAYEAELVLFKQIGNKSVAGFITTNYDLLLDTIFDKFTTYIGQKELIFSQIQGISEIYKIHGCASKPESIVINEKDYIDFSERNAYLAAKLMTIFLEHPIIFLGYSISDKNIENILKSIVKCLSQEHLEKLKERLIFIEWSKDGVEDISTYSKSFEGEKSIDMTRVRISDFSILYEALLENKAKYNVSMLRRLKDDIYELVLTNKPTSKIRTVGLEDDDKLDQLEVVVGIGVLSEFGQRGYLGVTADEIYRDIVLDDGDFEYGRIISDTLPILLPRNSLMLPIYKYLRDYTDEIPSVVNDSRKSKFDQLLSNTIKKNCSRHIEANSTIDEIETKYSLQKCLQIIPYLKQENIDAEDLSKLLKKVFIEIHNVLDKGSAGLRSDLKRVIRIYDWLKYH